MVTYRGAADVITGAVQMQQVVERENRHGAEPLSMRVGISVGRREPSTTTIGTGDR